jgi:hypothetical protein
MDYGIRHRRRLGEFGDSGASALAERKAIVFCRGPVRIATRITPDMHAFTADVAAGRTFWNVFTPYLDLGADLVWARETTDVVALQSEAMLVPRVTGGIEFRYWHVGLGTEAHVSALTSFQLQFAATF